MNKRSFGLLYVKSLIIVLLLLVSAGTASAWLSGYDYRMPIQVNNTGNNLTFYQYNFTADTASLVSAGKMQADGSDCQIANNTNGLQPFWNETAFNTSTTKIWVNATSLDNVTNTTHYMYYGNAAADMACEGDNTFEFFDNFTGVGEWTAANNATNLSIPTYEGTGDCLHPDIVHFDTAWNGYTYWMAMTPDASVAVENPSIVVSNDGYTWIEPPGITNPIHGPPGVGHYSDTDLIYNNYTDELWCYWRGDDIYRMISSDGTNWTDFRSVLAGPPGMLISPAITKEGSDYYMWVVDNTKTPYELVLYNSTNGTGWDLMANCSYNIPAVLGTRPLWHPNVFKSGDTYIGIFCFGLGGQVTTLCYAESTNKINWTVQETELLSPSASGWDDTRIYRTYGEFDDTGAVLRLWYSAYDSSNNHRIGYTEATADIDYSLDTSKWTTHKQGSDNSTVGIEDGYLNLSGAPNTISSGNIRSIQIFTNNTVFEFRRKGDSANYLHFSVGSGAVTDRTGGSNWWHTSLLSGYMFEVMLATAHKIWATPSSPGTPTEVASSTASKTETSYTNHKLIISDEASDNIRWYYDGTLFLEGTSTTWLSNEKRILITQGEYSDGRGGIQKVDWVFVRKYAATEPTSSLGTEESTHITIPGSTWFYTFLIGENIMSLAEIKSSMNNDGLDCWEAHRWSGTAYTTTGDVKPCEGIVVYNNVSGDWAV